MRLLSIVVTGILVSISAFSAAPEKLSVKADTLYPEGIAFNEKTSDFYLSSLRKGTIGMVNQAGVYSEFSNDADLISTVGLSVDAARNRLIACVSDPGVGMRSNAKTKEKLARLVIFDIETKKKLKTLDLGKLKAGKHFCNDMTVDADGNIYVTDSFVPVIYKVTPDYKTSVFVTSDKFKGEGFNLNGIVYHPSGFLLVAKYNDGTLWKVPLKNPKDLVQVTVPSVFSALDGLVLASNNDVIGIQNGKDNQIVRFKTTDDWKSATAQASASELQFPTTGVKALQKVYVIEGKLGELFADPAKAAAKEYTIKGFAL
jgi:sugar lactone lactonase YvrE